MAAPNYSLYSVEMENTQSRLITFSGLPGTGKTTLAKLLAVRLCAIYLRIDTIEQALARCSLKIALAEDAGYETAYAIASDNLIIGRSIVADSVNPIALTRDAWFAVAKSTNAKLLEVEIICSNKDEHKNRIQSRRADISGHILPTWDQVLKREYEPWNRNRLVIDTASNNPDECLSLLMAATGNG